MKKNIEINDEILEIMKQFIENYEDLENAYNEYIEICKETIKIQKINEPKNLIEIIEQKINKNLIQRITYENTTQLENEYYELLELYNKLSLYKKVVKIKKELENKKIENENQKKLSIKEIYISIKNIYELYLIIYKYENKNIPIIKRLKLKKFINKKQNNENIPFLIKVIDEFNKIEGPKIIDAIKETKKIPDEIVIDNEIKIITQYVKTKSA